MARPWLDLTEVIEDPYFEDSFTVLRRKQTVNSFGEPVIVVEHTYPDVGGIVIPTGNNSLVRQEAFESQQNAIQIITKFRLRPASKDGTVDYQPDIVQWDGSSYLVRTSNEYTRFGAGFVQVDCIATDYNPAPPAESTDC